MGSSGEDVGVGFEVAAGGTVGDTAGVGVGVVSGIREAVWPEEAPMPRDLSKFVARHLEASRCTECGAQAPEATSRCDELLMSILVPLFLV